MLRDISGQLIGQLQVPSVHQFIAAGEGNELRGPQQCRGDVQSLFDSSVRNIGKGTSSNINEGTPAIASYRQCHPKRSSRQTPTTTRATFHKPCGDYHRLPPPW